MKKCFAFIICVLNIGFACVNAAERFDVYHILPRTNIPTKFVEFISVTGESLLVPANHPLLHKANLETLEKYNVPYKIIDERDVTQVHTVFSKKFLEQIFTIEPADIDTILTKMFIDHIKNGNKKIRILPRSLNKLFEILNLEPPIKPIPDMPDLNDNIALQYIALVFTNQQWKPGFDPFNQRKSMIGPYLTRIKKQYGNDNEAYQAAMKPIKQALFHTLRYLADLNSQSIESLKFGTKIVTENELTDYFFLGGGTYLGYMANNLTMMTTVDPAYIQQANAGHLEKFKKYLLGLLQTAVKKR